MAYVNGPDKPPVIYVGSNEEYTQNTGDEGPINASDVSLGALGSTGLLTFGNGRMYAIKPTGGGLTCAGGKCQSSAYEPGWPVKIGIIDEGLLPDVGEGINGSPVVAPVTCPSGGGGMKIGVSPDAGPALHAQPGRKLLLRVDQRQYNTLVLDDGSGVDHPAFAAVGYPAFGTLDGSTVSMFDQGAGVIRALDVAVNGEQKGGQDFILGWNAASGQFSTGYPAPVNDLGFLTGETVGDITGQAPPRRWWAAPPRWTSRHSTPPGQPASSAWPKLSGDWVVATRTLGAFGTLDSDAGAHKDVVTITRSGHAVGLHDARVRLLAVVVAQLAPRHRQLRRLHPRRRPARCAAVIAGLPGAADVHLAGQRPDVRNACRLRGGQRQRAVHGRSGPEPPPPRWRAERRRRGPDGDDDTSQRRRELRRSAGDRPGGQPRADRGDVHHRRGELRASHCPSRPTPSPARRPSPLRAVRRQPRTVRSPTVRCPGGLPAGHREAARDEAWSAEARDNAGQGRSGLPPPARPPLALSGRLLPEPDRHPRRLRVGQAAAHAAPRHSADASGDGSSGSRPPIASTLCAASGPGPV